MIGPITSGRRLASLCSVLIAFLILAPMTALAGPGFQQTTLVSGLNQPVALDFVPGGDDLYITEKDGALKYFNGNATSTALDLTSAVCTESERGLLGVAVDPDFNNGSKFVYLFYTSNQNGTCKNRVSRFVAAGDGSLSSEKILLDKIGSPCGNHNGGDIQFAGDKTLYVSVGDGGCNHRTSHAKNTLNGKILRINRDGTAPASNPFAGKKSANCSKTGETRTNKPCREIWALGFRNPFRIAFNATGKVLYVNDVGENTWEEINRGAAGDDYGWNQCEGFKILNSSKNCEQGGASLRKFTEPEYVYNHSSGLRSITGGAFLPAGGPWAPALQGRYVFADLLGGLYLLRPAGNGFQRTTLIANGDNPISLTIGPDKALYYTSLDSGEVRRVAP